MFASLPRARMAAACLLALLSVAPAAAQTWVGGTNNQWNTGSNWSTGSVPISSFNTHLSFGAAPQGSLQNNIPGTFLLNQMTFDADAPAYTFSGNALNFINSTLALNPRIIQNSANSVTIGNDLVLTNSLTIDGSGVGTVTLSGTLSGGFGLTVSTPGTVILGSGSNSFGGDVVVESGTLSITSPTAIPGGRNVSVLRGGVFRMGAATNNNSASPIGLLGLAGGTFRVPVGLAEYYVEQLTLAEAVGVASAIDFSGSTNFRLHLTGSAGGILVAGDTTWTGGGTSSIQNDRSTAIAIATTSTITNSIRLLNGTGGRGFQLTGGGTLVLTNSGNTAHLEVDGSTLEVADMAYLGTGVTVLRRTAGTNPGTLKYTGLTAASTKQILLGPGDSRIWVTNPASELSLTGTIGEAASGATLIVAGGGTLSLTGTNTFNRTIFVRDGAVLSVPAIPDGGVAGPLGVSSNLPSNLVVGFNSAGTLRYTGATATTDRGVFFGTGNFGILDVADPGANLSVNGQIAGGAVTKTGPGTLTFGSTLNSFTGDVSIQGGTLAISRATAIPADADVAVGSGAEFRLAFGSGSNLTGPIGSLTLNGTLAVPASDNGNYAINRLEQGQDGGVNFIGSDNFRLRFTGTGAGINVSAHGAWIGPGNTSRIQNDTSAPLDLTIAPGVTLTSSIELANGSANQGFRLIGGGTLAVNNTGNSAAITIVGASTLRFGDVDALGAGVLTLDGGRLEYTGTTNALTKPIILGAGGGTMSVTNPAANLNWTGPLAGGNTLTKTGPGSVWLNGAHVLGGLVIDGGRVDVSNDAVLGAGQVVVNPAGTLRYRASATTARTFTLNGGTIETSGGDILTMNGATVNGGFLASFGSGKFVLTNSAAVNGSTLYGGTNVDIDGPAAFTNVTTGANVTVAAGHTLVLNRGLQTAAGTLTVNGTVNATSGWESTGVLRVTGGANPALLSVDGAPLVLGGGSRTYIGTNAAGQRGGTIRLSLGNTIELNGGLLVNNGDFISAGNGGIHNGTVNVNYGSLAKGTGYYDAVNVTDGGKFAPGNSITDSTIGTLTLNSGSVYEFEINLANGLPGGGGTTPPQGWDRLSMTRMNVNSTPESPAIVQLVSRNAADTGPGTLPDFDPAQSYRWQAFQGELFFGFAPDKFVFDTTQFANLTDPTGIGTFALEQSGSSIFVTYTPVPEPGLMLVIGVLGLAAGRMIRGAAGTGPNEQTS